MTDNKKMPNQEGYFGKYGGRYVAETLVPALEELSEKYHEIKNELKLVLQPVHLVKLEKGYRKHFARVYFFRWLIK